MKHTGKVKNIEWLAYNVVKLEISKPEGFSYEVGDAVEIKVGEQEPGPFTMTNLPSGNHLEFVIRIYPEHHGKTAAISELKIGDQIAHTEPFNTFKPQEGAVFLAGGTGITPFIAIMRHMHQSGSLKDSLLFFSNKSRKDLFLEDELVAMLGDRYQNVITEDTEDPAYYGKIDEEYIKTRLDSLNRPMLVCGPPPFSEAMEKTLLSIGVEKDLIDLGN